MTLEVRVPVSPTPSFLARARLIAASVRRFYPDAIVTAYVGADADVLDTLASLPPPDGLLDYKIIARPAFNAWRGTANEYVGTMAARFRPPYRGDHILMLDADCLCTHRFDELFNINAIQGVQAHVPAMSNQEGWRLFHYVGVDPLPLVCPYSGAGIMCQSDARGLFYGNSGVLFFPRRFFERMTEHYHQAIEMLRMNMKDSYWFDQIAVALAVAKAGVPTKSLSLKFNFPNQAAFDDAHPEELADCRFLHYLRTDTVDRDRDFASVAAMQRFIARPGLVGSNALLQRRVGQLLNKVWPAAEYTAEDAPHA